MSKKGELWLFDVLVDAAYSQYLNYGSVGLASAVSMPRYGSYVPRFYFHGFFSMMPNLLNYICRMHVDFC